MIQLGMRKWQAIAIAMGVAGTIVILGCGGDESGLARRYSVSGKVTYKGEPVSKGTISFQPVKPPYPEGRAAEGTISNGNYSLSTAGGGDGALPGEYKVIVIASTLDLSELAKKTGGMIHQGEAEHKKAIAEAKSLVPVKYNKAETTDLKATVEPKSQAIDFDLKD
jgi:hypothetical protein